jgi:hypothetical protein
MIFKSAKYGFIAFIVCFFMLSFVASCNHKGSEDQLKKTTDSFSTNYFNWHFKEALPYVTDDSHKWLRYAASQVHQADIDILRNMEQGATHEIGDIEFVSDSVAYVLVNVNNFLSIDTIGTEGHIVDQATFRFKAVYFNNEWKIKLNSLPRMNVLE